MSLRSAALRTAEPFIPRPLRDALHLRRFFAARQWRNLHWGVFDSFDAANAFVRARGEAPRFDMDQTRWLSDRQALLPHDYPMLFWLDHLLHVPGAQHLSRIVDLGGSVGISYIAYKPYLELPPDLMWVVCELPEVAEFGRQVAHERGETRLSFHTDFSPLDGADLLFTAGTIQYLETPLDELLAGVERAPPHLLINRLPLTPHKRFVTLQNSGVAVWPYRIDNDDAFVGSLTRLGYRLVDRWKCLQNSTDIPFHPELRLDHFHGFYFTRTNAG